MKIEKLLTIDNLYMQMCVMLLIPAYYLKTGLRNTVMYTLLPWVHGIGNTSSEAVAVDLFTNCKRDELSLRAKFRSQRSCSTELHVSVLHVSILHVRCSVKVFKGIFLT